MTSKGRRVQPPPARGGLRTGGPRGIAPAAAVPAADQVRRRVLSHGAAASPPLGTPRAGPRTAAGREASGSGRGPRPALPLMHCGRCRAPAPAAGGPSGPQLGGAAGQPGGGARRRGRSALRHVGRAAARDAGRRGRAGPGTPGAVGGAAAAAPRDPLASCGAGRGRGGRAGEGASAAAARADDSGNPATGPAPPRYWRGAMMPRAGEVEPRRSRRGRAVQPGTRGRPPARPAFSRHGNGRCCGDLAERPPCPAAARFVREKTVGSAGCPRCF